jgi:hypothetical protein
MHAKDGAASVFIKRKNRTCKAALPKGKGEWRCPFNLLPGYTIKYGYGIEGQFGGDIQKEGGPSIRFDFGSYHSVETEEKPDGKVVWQEEQTVGANHFILVYTREQELAASLIGLDRGNFKAKIRNSKELSEVLLTILSFDETRGYPFNPARMQELR